MTWLGRLIRRWRERAPDPAWAPTGVRQVFVGYDQAKPGQAAQRADALALHRRDLAQQRAGLATPAIITDIAERRTAR